MDVNYDEDYCSAIQNFQIQFKLNSSQKLLNYENSELVHGFDYFMAELFDDNYITVISDNPGCEEYTITEYCKKYHGEWIEYHDDEDDCDNFLDIISKKPTYTFFINFWYSFSDYNTHNGYEVKLNEQIFINHLNRVKASTKSEALKEFINCIDMESIDVYNDGDIYY